MCLVACRFARYTLRMWWPWKRKKLAPHLRQGLWGERQAERYLRKRGFRILGRRVRLGPREEIDLVARYEGALVFVEVKTRRNEAVERPSAAVHRRKQEALARAAGRYLQRLKWKPEGFRFDVVEVIGSEDQGCPRVRHTPNAFHPPRMKGWAW